MAFKNRLTVSGLRRILLVSFFFLTSFLWAQTEIPLRDALRDESRFIHNLAWTGDEYALRYEVVVEKEEDGQFRPLLREFTDAFEIEIALSPGQYRCRVIPYDYLERPGTGSEWMSISVAAVPGDTVIVHVEPEPLKKELVEEEPYSEPETPKKDRGFYLYASAGWMPLFALYYEDVQPEDQNYLLKGAVFRLGLISAKPEWLNLGVEAAVSWCVADSTSSLGSFTFHWITADLTLVAQKWLSGNKAALRYRVGAGIPWVLNNEGNLLSQFSWQNLHLTLGLSFLWLPANHFFLEGGLDYTHLLSGDLSGDLRPWIGLGFRF